MAGPPIIIEDNVPRELRQAIYSMYDRCSWIVEFLEEIVVYLRMKRREKGLDPERADFSIGETYVEVIIDENTVYNVPVRLPPNLARLISETSGIRFRPVPFDHELTIIQSFLTMINATKRLIDDVALVALSQPGNFAFTVIQLGGGYRGRYSSLVKALRNVPVSIKIDVINRVGEACVSYKDMNLAEYLEGKLEEVPEEFKNYTVFEYFSEGLWKHYKVDEVGFYVGAYNPISITAITGLSMLIKELEHENIDVNAEGVREHYLRLLGLIVK